MSATIRPYRPGDEEGAYHVCLKTGDSGRDGTPYYQDDPDSLGRIYVGPYLKFEPTLSWILEDEQGIAGYCLAALDSRKFYQQYDQQWRPELCEQFPDPTGDSADWTRLEQIYHLYHHPDYDCPEPYEKYPSHLHIDLLPRVQGQGFGRRMIEQQLAALEAAGSPGVHLGLGIANDRAYKFYQAVGFQELERDDDSIYMGKPLGSSQPSP